METLIGIILFFFGTIIGSFLNVVILRMNTGRTLGGRSMCFSCGKSLHWHELVPLASFLVQKGKCTKCSAKISWQYPIVEGITGLMFMFVGLKLLPFLPLNLELFLIHLVFAVFIFSVWIAISVYDIRHTIIPNNLVWGVNAVIFASLFLLKGGALVVHMPDWSMLLAGPVIALPFAALWLFSKGKLMGLGDAKLMLGIGWLLGIIPGVVAVVVAFWMGALVSLFLMAFAKKRYGMRSAIPFGPFLIASTFLIYLIPNLYSIFSRFFVL